MANPSTNYDAWTRDDLIARLTLLDRPKPSHNSSPQPQLVAQPKKTFNFSAYHQRKIALKFCYSGWEYGGLAYQNLPTPLPTVEGVIFHALSKARLIDPGQGMDGCGWEKCGRTDRGVSAAGQVISLWVRSAFEKPETDELPANTTTPLGQQPPDPTSSSTSDEQASVLNPTKPEHDYLAILNRLLPPTIRILAWSPVPSTFSARFACSYRHYKYFFSPLGLDVERMQNAALRLVGEHDFRNLCKLDPGKQITSFMRRIMRADIESLGDSSSVHVFNLVGSAFLYHQVRHIMAVLFMVGSGVEHPSVITSLMNIQPGMETPFPGDPPLAVVDCKPEYQMADALPLMLWDCGYPEGLLDWRISGRDPSSGEKNEGSGLYHQMQAITSRSEIYHTLDQHFLAAASQYHPVPPTESGSTLNLPLGGGTHRRYTRYVELLSRPRLDDVAVMNERWRLGKGSRREKKRTVNDDDGDE